MSRRLTTILAADVVGFSKLAGADEEGTVSRLRALGQEVIDPVTAAHSGRLFKTTGDGRLIEFGSVVDAVRAAIELQGKIAARNADIVSGKRMEFRIGIHVGDVMVETDGDLMGDGVNIAARLEGIAETGGICISEDAYRQVRDKIAAEFHDLGERSLKNIARPIRVYRVRDAAAPQAAERELLLPDKPSLAVLPFNVLQGDADGEALADGLTEDIVTALSRMRELFVIARNSSFTYKGRAIDVRQVGRELGVRYVLEGSVRRSGSRLRVTAQLIEASSGNHIWAEKYDRPAADVFDIQDDITRSVAASTQTHIQLHEGARSMAMARPDLNVWLLIKRSWARLYELTPESLVEARALAEKAVELAPESGQAREVLGNVLVHQVFMLTVPDRRETLLKAREAAEKAARLEGWTEYTYWCLGMVQFASREYDQAILTLQQGLAINPNCALIHASTGNYLALRGRADDGIAETELAIRINPRDPSLFFRYQALSDAFFVKRDFEKMLEWAAKAMVLKPSYFASHLRHIAALSLLGRDAAIAPAVARYERDVPEAVRARAHRGGFVREEDETLFSAALAKTGLAAG